MSTQEEARAAMDRVYDEHREDLYNGGAPRDEDPRALRWWRDKAAQILEDALTLAARLEAMGGP